LLVQQHGGSPPIEIGAQIDASLFDPPLEGTLANNLVLPQHIGVQGPYHATQAGYYTSLNSNIPINENGNGYLSPLRIDNTPIQYEHNTHAAGFPGFGTGDHQSFNANQANVFPIQGGRGLGTNMTGNDWNYDWNYQPDSNSPWGAKWSYGTSFGNGADVENVGNGEHWNNGDGFNNGM
jgi:hypothetical protein